MKYLILLFTLSFNLPFAQSKDEVAIQKVINVQLGKRNIDIDED